MPNVSYFCKTFPGGDGVPANTVCATGSHRRGGPSMRLIDAHQHVFWHGRDDGPDRRHGRPRH